MGSVSPPATTLVRHSVHYCNTLVVYTVRPTVPAMWRALCASVTLWLVLLPTVVCQTSSICRNDQHTDEKRIQAVYHSFGRPQKDREECDQAVCRAGLPSATGWTFFGFGLTFSNAQAAVLVESCHVQCMQMVSEAAGCGGFVADVNVPCPSQHVNSSGSGTGGELRNLYALSCEDNPKVS